MRYYLFFYVIMIVFFSCDSTVPKKETVFVNDTTTVQDTVIFIRDSTMAQHFADSLPEGAYQGVFPCTNCEGIQQTILFTADKKYRREEITWGKDGIKKTEGTWERKDNRIVLYVNTKPVMKLKLRSDTLFTVENNGTRITDSTKYFLDKRTLSAERPHWEKRTSQGIDFAGVGNEPFWSLEIDNEKMIFFQMADWGKPVIVPIEKPHVTKDSTVYTLPHNNSLWFVTIYPNFCSDGMSDFLYEYKVAITFDGQTYRGCGVHLKK